MADIFSELSNTNSKPNLMNMLDPANASGWEAEGKRLAVNLPEVTVRDAAKFVAEMTPILGDAIAAKELWDMATSDNPNWPLIGAMGGATVIGLIPGIGDAAAKGIKAGAKKMLDTAKRVEVDPNAMGSLLGNVRLKPKGEVGDVAKPAGIRAYHGSPHSFDKFSMDKIGTGEGAQAYGHGLYFAENEAVADSYKQSIRRNSEELRRIAEREGGLSGDAAEMLSYQFSMDDFHGKGFDKWLEDLKKSRDDGMLPMRSKKAIDEIINRSVEASDAVRVMKNPGSMYEVNINANPDDFLDWDAPLSAQSQSVQDAFVGINAGDDALLREILDTSPEGMMMQGMMPNAKGSAAYRTLMERGFEDGAVGLNLPAGNPMKPADKWASERLRKAGIPGIKYLDAGSRGTDAATRNFVVFNENLINIVKKYGIAGAATMLGVSAMDVEQAMAQGAQQPSNLLALLEMQKRANEEQQM